jgi:predicted phage terminase large subunit-like protein
VSIDTALKGKSESDFHACTVWGTFLPNEGSDYSAMLMEAWRERCSYPDLKRRVKETLKRWTIDGKQPDYVLIEDTACGPALIADLQESGIRVRKFNPGNTPKITRAHLVSDVLDDGLVWVPGRKLEDGTRDPETLTVRAEAVVAECEVFPNGENDDYVDTCTQAWSLLRDIGALTPESFEEPEDVNDGPGSPFDDDEIRTEFGGDEGYF